MRPLTFFIMKVRATITRIVQETPLVKSFLLDLGSADFSFLPGQWVDFYIATGGSMQVGGFSITSSPLQRGSIEIAVKKIPSGVPSVYLHERARVGDSFMIEGGSGEFYYQRDMGSSVVLIAGGIGITPLMSILRYIDEAHPDVEATLLYSAKAPSELLFWEALRAMAERNPRVRCALTVTQPGGEPWQGRRGRIDRAMLKELMPGKESLFYVCGPMLMLEDVSEALVGLGVTSPCIRTERWW
ncbi:MAG: FAD-dependent oxidoreductase [Dehalococcoidia bacterium]|nr:FAD-dependent oxidoreductase [Dehalococcoidia bacterium]